MEEIIDELNRLRHFRFKEIENDEEGYEYKVKMGCNKTKHLIAELFSKVEGDFRLQHVYTEDYNNVYFIYFNDLKVLRSLLKIASDNKIYNILFEAYHDLEYQYLYDKNKIKIGDNLMVKRVISDGISREVKGVVDYIYDNYALITTNAGYNTTVSIQ